MLTTFVRKPQVIDAAQFDGSMLSAQVLRRAAPGVTLEFVAPVPPAGHSEWTGRLLVRGLAGVQPAVTGDYVVTEGRDTYVVGPDEFEAEFQRAG